MILHVFPSGPLQTNAILLGCKRTNNVVCIDPSMGSFSFFERTIEKNNYTPVAIWLTHSHWDHIVDVASVKERYSLPVYVHPLDAKNLEDPGSDHLPLMMPIEGVKPTHFFKDKEHLQVGSLDVEVLHTPGHSQGSVCFYIRQEKTLLSGDTIFQGSIGNISFPLSEPTKMWESCTLLSELPPDTRVIAGHGPETSIGKETWLSKAKHYFSMD